MKEVCIEEGMKLARWLHMLGLRGAGIANASYEEYQRLSREAGEALGDVDKMTCLSNDERSVLKKELNYLKEQAEKTNFLYTSDAGARLLHLLSNPQFYLEYYKPEKEEINEGNPYLERLTTPEKHQLKIAKDTLKMPDAMARVMGGMSKEEAREVIKKLEGRGVER